MATIVTKNSSTASATPSAGQLVQGELAVNVTDKKVYTKDSGGSVVKLVGSLGNQEANAVNITGGTISGVALSGSASVNVQRFSGNGSTTVFTLAADPVSENNTQVYIQGVYQQKNTYTVSGTTLTFSTAPLSGTNNIEVVTTATQTIGTTTAALTSYLPDGTGAVTTTVQEKLRESVSVKDFGAVGDGVTNDTTAIQAALNAGLGAVYFPPGVYVVTSEIVVPDGSGIIGAGAHWKRRTGYTYNGAHQTVFKYTGAGGANSCVVRLSNKAVGVFGTDFGPPGTDDLLDLTARDFHIDANNLAEIGCYVYRAGNQAALTNITVECAKKFNHVHLGCFAADFGTFGSFESEEHGVACGWDIFGWNNVEATNFAYRARFLIGNNGTAGTYVAGTATDLDGSGGMFSVGRGSRVYITSEGNKGRACLLSQYNIATGAGGSSDYFLEYLEGNADGPYVDYRDGMDAIRLRCGFIHPGNGGMLLPQTIKIEGKDNTGVVAANSGPATSSEWLVIDGAVGDLAGVGFPIDSNTYKYHVKDCTGNIVFSATPPAVTKNSDNAVNAGVYFTAASSPTIWKAINGTLARVSTGTYVFTFKHEFKSSGSVVPMLSVILDSASPYDTEVRLSSISATSATIRVYDSTSTLSDTGDRISLMFIGELK